MTIKSSSFEHATALDLKIGGTAVLSLDAAGVSIASGKNKDWFLDLLGDNFAVGGQGAAYGQVTIGSRVYNAWELPNHASNSPFIEVNFWLPPDYDGAELAVQLCCFRTATATGTAIDTRCRLACIGVGDTMNPTLSTAVDVVDTVGANETPFLVDHSLTPANAADGGLCHGIIQRVPSLPADDYTGSVYLLGARVRYA